MNIMLQVLLILMVYLCVYNIVNRVCTCIEICSWYKSYPLNKVYSIDDFDTAKKDRENEEKR